MIQKTTILLYLVVIFFNRSFRFTALALVAIVAHVFPRDEEVSIVDWFMFGAILPLVLFPRAPSPQLAIAVVLVSTIGMAGMTSAIDNDLIPGIMCMTILSQFYLFRPTTMWSYILGIIWMSYPIVSRSKKFLGRTELIDYAFSGLFRIENTVSWMM